jgi:hypothetical protein
MMEVPMAKQPDQGWSEHVLNSLPTMEATTSVTPATGLTPGPVAETTAQPPFSLGPALSPQVDLLELLPPGAADKLRALRQRSDDLHAIIPLFAELQEATGLKQDAERALKRLTAHPSERGHNLPETDSRVVIAQQHLDKMAADLKRLQERSETRSQAWLGIASEGCLRKLASRRQATRHRA